MRGRPLRFLVLATLAWTTTRIIVQWPQAALPAASSEDAAATSKAAPPRRVAVQPDIAPTKTATFATYGTELPEATRHFGTLPARRRDTVPAEPDRDPLTRRPAASHAAGDGVAIVSPDLPGHDILDPGTPTPPPADGRPDRHGGVRDDRWSGSAWLLLRAGTPSPAFGGQLAGSQGGVRVTYAASDHLALVARLTAPTRDPGREASFGVEWHLSRLPVRLVVEQRIALDRTHGGPAIGVIGGAGPAPVGAGFSVAGYGQAGVIKRQRAEPFAEGAVRIAHAAHVFGPARVDIGAGIWGGVQRDAARVDIGPSLGLSLPVGEASLRATLDWRQRMAGHARPGSGLAVTLGGDF